MDAGLTVAPCSRKAAEYAVLNWHYSHRMPAGKLVTFGAWEDDRYIGAVVFGRGASPYLLPQFGITQYQGCELVRVALRAHAAPVSQVVAEALRQLHVSNSGLRLVVSFADPARGHVGGIYQAGNWIYTGTSTPQAQYFYRGRWAHSRTAGDRKTGLTKEQFQQLPRRAIPGKYRYVYPLDRAMRRRVARLALPFPRGSGVDGDAPGVLLGEPGSTPGNRSTRPATGAA